MNVVRLEPGPRPLVAVVLPPGPVVVGAVDEALQGGAAVGLLDPSLPVVAQEELLEVLRPQRVLRDDGQHELTRSRPVGAQVAVAVATSGSTGTPRLVLHAADRLLASARAALDRLSAWEAPWLCCLPTSHLGGLGVVIRCLLSDAPLTVLDWPRTEEIAAVLDARRGWTSLVPTQLRRLVELGAPLAGQGLLLGGAALDPALRTAAEAAGARVVATYGLTETAGGCVYDGAPLDGVEVAVDGDGRIRLRGPVTALGLRGPEGDEPATDPDGWIGTADLGRLRGDGRLEVLGRADEVISTGGEKVAPGPVERALRELDGIADAVVVGVPDPEWGEAVTALVVPSGPPPRLADVRAALAERLPAAARPRVLVLVDELPHLPSGKHDRRRAAQLARRSASGLEAVGEP